ncbi:MAG: hydrogenase iron-sulfur subunit [Coriobacteriia bacterium]|nr:hydrogenase iron-sulfur subunit [Coriobacteriia bacterium]
MSVVEASEGTQKATVDANFEPTILAIACHWCTYTGADLAGMNRMNYPPNVRVLRVPCSGRVNPQYILTALNKGCDGVLVCGCHPGDCHYVSGNYYAKRRLMAFKRLLEYTGLEEGRLLIRWISGSEAGKFRDTVTEICQTVKALGPLSTSEQDALTAFSRSAAGLADINANVGAAAGFASAPEPNQADGAGE